MVPDLTRRQQAPRHGIVAASSTAYEYAYGAAGPNTRAWSTGRLA
ncbi:hypothetical protein [Streptomyces sp. NPDC017673]